MQLKDKTILITGAGSGIGRALAQVLARRGCHLALVDLNSNDLTDTRKLVNDLDINITTHVADVTQRQEIDDLLASILGQHSGLDVLINNAGIAAGGSFTQLSEETFNKVMNVNFHAVVNLTRLCLPHLFNRDEGRIVNISSLFGIITPPDQTAYCASKFAVRGFSNSLRFELEGTNVGVSVVHPGGVNTNIAKRAIAPEGVSEEEIRIRREEEDKLLTMPPLKAAEIIVRGIEKNLPRILVGNDAKIISWLERIMPINYWKIVGRIMEKKKTS